MGKRKKQNNKIKIIESIIAIVILALISIFGTENEILNQLNRKEEVSSTSTAWRYIPSNQYAKST